MSSFQYHLNISKQMEIDTPTTFEKPLVKEETAEFPTSLPTDTSVALTTSPEISLTLDPVTEDVVLLSIDKDNASSQPSNTDNATLQAIAAAQNEYGTRVRGAKSDKPDVATSLTPQPQLQQPPISSTSNVMPIVGPLKKRPAPKVSNKSGIKKPASKKRRIDGSDTASQRRSTSNTPMNSSPSRALNSEGESGSEEDPNVVYCICRRPDNHTWMIGCDGGCEDWFHGKCVNIKREDEGLIDKYICPHCAAKDRGVTTWKPMCRRNGCRKPARLKKGGESKYCSNDCGILFMKGNLKRAGIHPSKKGNKMDLEQEMDLGPLGGPLRRHEVKALAVAASTITEFRQFGMIGISSLAKNDMSMDMDSHFTPHEVYRLHEIADRKTALRDRRNLLKEREKFVVMAKEQASQAGTSAKLKDLCGFDARLAWDESTFKNWRTSDNGEACFKDGKLDASSDVEGSILCARRKCQRHTAWQKLALQDVRFEEADVADEMRRIDGEEQGIRRGMSVRALMKSGGEQHDEGSVEIVE